MKEQKVESYDRGNRIGAVLLLAQFLLLSMSCRQSDQAMLKQKVPAQYQKEVELALDKSGENRSELLASIRECPVEQMDGLAFLIANMPERDLKSLTADFMLENINLAYKVMQEIPWGSDIAQDMFLNYVLPYANLHERRDNWRADFYEKFLPLVKNAETPGEAAVILNEKMWDIVNVHYSTKRPKADQSPYESIEAGMASCTGLSILLVDACRAVGVPARFVGIPLWADHSGNHSWVEIWDNGWHVIGAGEPGPLNETWFMNKASMANDNDWKYSIYAASFKKTGVIFPPLFDSTATYVNADIVTIRYSKKNENDGKVTLAIRLFDRAGGKRIVADVVAKIDGQTVARGETRDDKRDYNDFLIFRLMPNATYDLSFTAKGLSKQVKYTTSNEKYQFLNYTLNGAEK